MEKRNRRDFLKKASLGTIGAVAAVVGVKETISAEVTSDNIFYNNSLEEPFPLHTYTFLPNSPSTIIGDPVSGEIYIKAVILTETEDEVLEITESGCYPKRHGIELFDYTDTYCGNIINYHFQITKSATDHSHIQIIGCLIEGSMPLSPMQETGSGHWTIYHNGRKYTVGLISYDITYKG